VLLLWTLLIWQAAAAPTSWPIESLTVENPGEYSEQEILNAAGLKLGQSAGKDELERARQRLLDTGLFGGVGYRYKPSGSGKGIAVTIELAEAGELYPVRFERMPVAAEQLAGCLESADPLFRKRLPATDRLLRRYSALLETCLEQMGKPLRVSARLWPDQSNQLALVFSPLAPAPAIASVQFTGNQAVPAGALVRAINAVAIGAPYIEENFRQFLDASVRPLYEARGRLGVSFPKISAAPAEGIDGVAVTVEVSEGDVYTLGKIDIEGGPLPAEEIQRMMGLEEGAVADMSRVAAALGRIEQRMRRDGYLKPEIDLKRNLDERARRADLIITVNEGRRYVFGKLEVRGLNLDAEAEVRRRWALKPGRPYDADYPELFLKRIAEEGLFDNLGKTRAEVKIDEEAARVDVILIFAGSR